MIYDKLAALGYFIKIDYFVFWGKIRFAPGKSKKELLYLTSDRDSVLRIPLRLKNIAQYADKLGQLSSKVLHQTLQDSNCAACGGCKKGIAFSYDGTNYKKCYVICSGFVYSGLEREDFDSLIQLIDWELGD